MQLLMYSGRFWIKLSNYTEGGRGDREREAGFKYVYQAGQ